MQISGSLDSATAAKTSERRPTGTARENSEIDEKWSDALASAKPPSTTKPSGPDPDEATTTSLTKWVDVATPS